MDAIITSLIVALCSILLDFILGVLISIKDKTFDLSKLPQFLKTNLFPYIGGLLVVAAVAIWVPTLNYLFYAGGALVTAKFCKEALLDKVKLLFS